MNPHFSPFRVARLTPLLGLGMAGLTCLHSPLAQAKVYLEPLVYASSGRSDYQSIVQVDGQNNLLNVSSTFLIGYGATARFGVMNENEDIFSAIELGGGQAALTGAGFGFLYSIGLTVGYTLKYTPIRLVMGYDLSESYSDARVSLGGASFRAGLGYFLKENMLLNLDFSRRLFTEIGLKDNRIETVPREVSYNAVQLSISLPMMFESAKTPWRNRYRTASLNNQAQSAIPADAEAPPEGSPPLEDNPPPPADQGELPPAPEGMAPPDAAPPPDEAPPPELLSPAEQELLNPQ